ncbi:MAG TPA: hypothetical protein VF135_02430, partial [Terriglobales bacterium]
IKNVVVSTPLRVLRLPAVIEPGSEATLKFSLDTTGVGNFYEGVIVVSTSDPSMREFQLTFDGDIVSTVEVSPMPAFYVASQQGETKEASVEIINHESDPLRIQQVENPSSRFKTRMETIEDGGRYRLVLQMRPDAPLGKSEETILVHTSSTRFPIIRIGAHTYVRDRVYTFPPAVEFGQVRLADLRGSRNAVSRTAQRLIVYESAGKDFQVNSSCDLPFISVTSQTVATGDRVQLFLTIDPSKVVAPGSYKGAVRIRTNDAKVPRLDVPISIAISD